MIQITATLVSNNLARTLANLAENTHTLATIGIAKGFEVADETVPVDTGRLKASGHIEDTWNGDKSVALIYDARNDSRGDPYGRFVEYGTRFMAAQPFITPAFYAAVAEIVANAHVLVDD